MDKEFNEHERLYIGKTIAYEYSIKEHFDRYDFARKYLNPSFVVLDAACGTGYGTEFISGSVKHIVGLEISDHALEWANAHHKKDNVEFHKADLNEAIDFPDNHFDALVSFETIEHVAHQEHMLSEFKRVLKPNGILIVSSPDKNIINEDGVTYNQFHVHELTKKEFTDLMSKYFEFKELFGQAKSITLPWYKRAIKKAAKLDTLGIRRKIVKGLGLHYFVHKHFTPMAEIPIEKTDINSPDNYYTLIIVCHNNK